MSDKWGKWISVEDSLPDSGKDNAVLVAYPLPGSGGALGLEVAYIGTLTGYWRTRNGVQLPGVTHWQHLPTPPKDNPHV